MRKDIGARAEHMSSYLQPSRQPIRDERRLDLREEQEANGQFKIIEHEAKDNDSWASDMEEFIILDNDSKITVRGYVTLLRSFLLKLTYLTELQFYRTYGSNS